MLMWLKLKEKHQNGVLIGESLCENLAVM